ncbi:MAG: hypothetical protein ABIH25_00500 [Candidatus Woesearchaeota archaeon]
MNKKRGLKRSKEFSDTIVVILLVAVIIVSFIGSLLVYNNLSKAEIDVPVQNIIYREEVGNSDGTGMVAVNIVSREEKFGLGDT